ncbi:MULTISPECIES: large-conductance mechanosensitive channel protein MscL [unclassified Dysgonomonas]|uniref:large-conductance mechanosensitive channel protein MscL n=1 Tax=unclassified Dysgonomonas TaxID=2630389 RepID=UPI0006806AC6|nr:MULTISPECIES: large-conductance mechanosensitive channel protein MscL [unclassified Dysgonomonas]MBD8347346.1 large-conductance mechanosensitive channel protein MscL [Dysgonomonas sp. HGC4]MBF0576830.1 large-conductance mechanosensitive channel protein MscL [Dysgonomonas sp. GY617]
MAIVQELKAFMMRGNVVDMAVGVIVGGAFGQIVTSLVNDVIMPPIGVLLNGVNFTDLKLIIKEASVDAAGAAIPAVSLNYGNFIQMVINFIIISTAIFFVIKGMNSLQHKKEEVPAAPAAPSKEEVLLAEIRDLLKEKK